MRIHRINKEGPNVCRETFTEQSGLRDGTEKIPLKENMNEKEVPGTALFETRSLQDPFPDSLTRDDHIAIRSPNTAAEKAAAGALASHLLTFDSSLPTKTARPVAPSTFSSATGLGSVMCKLGMFAANL